MINLRVGLNNRAALSIRKYGDDCPIKYSVHLWRVYIHIYRWNEAEKVKNDS